MVKMKEQFLIGKQIHDRDIGIIGQLLLDLKDFIGDGFSIVGGHYGGGMARCLRYDLPYPF